MEDKTMIDDDFKEIEKDENKSYIKIVLILYMVVIVLTVLLIFGLKKQKSVIKNSKEEDSIKEINDSKTVNNLKETNEDSKDNSSIFRDRFNEESIEEFSDD